MQKPSHHIPWNRILKSTSGEILYKGNKLKYDKKSLYNLRKEVGIVFQDPEKQIFYSIAITDAIATLFF